MNHPNSRAGKHIFLDILHSEGVEMIFGNPGTTELPLLDAFVVEDRLRYILGLNEVVVMGMADGWAQATGRLAVCNLHAAPGLGNACGMLYNAAKAGAPESAETAFKVLEHLSANPATGVRRRPGATATTATYRLA